MTFSPKFKKSFGAAMYALAFLVAGIMFLLVGDEYEKPNPDYDNINSYIWVYACALMVAVVGIILEAELHFCVDKTNRSLGYFAELFELLGVFGMGAFGFGLAAHFSD